MDEDVRKNDLRCSKLLLMDDLHLNGWIRKRIRKWGIEKGV